MSAANLLAPHFQDADKAREYLEALRWPDGVICPHCGVIGEHYKLQGKSTRPGLWKCKDCRNEATCAIRRAMLIVRDDTARILDLPIDATSGDREA